MHAHDQPGGEGATGQTGVPVPYYVLIPNISSCCTMDMLCDVLCAYVAWYMLVVAFRLLRVSLDVSSGD